jgi:RNA polymerase sigma-70 factor (ECF subfamily)
MDEHKNSDELLMAAVAKGKRESLEILIRRHATPLLTFLERMCGDRHQGEELFQEVFLAVWKKRWQYQFPRSFKSWLYGIAVNKCRTAYRRTPAAGNVPQTEATNPQSNESSPLETAIATETAAIIGQAVTELPAQQRSVVVMRIWQQLSYGEIATLLDTTEGTVRSHMHHGLCALRKYLEPRLA